MMEIFEDDIILNNRVFSWSANYGSTFSFSSLALNDDSFEKTPGQIPKSYKVHAKMRIKEIKIKPFMLPDNMIINQPKSMGCTIDLTGPEIKSVSLRPLADGRYEVRIGKRVIGIGKEVNGVIELRKENWTAEK